MKRTSRFNSSLEEVKLRKMMRNGDIPVKYLVAGILAVLVLGGGLVANQKIGIITDWAKLLPGFNKSEPGVIAIVGINLEEHNNLEYFNGETWKKMDIPKDNAGFVMGSYEFNPANMERDLEGFYFNTRRKPGQFNLEINEWRYWVIYQELSSIVIYPYTKESYIGPPKSTYDHNFATFDAKISYDGLDKFKYGKGDYLVSFLSLDLFKSSSAFSKLISWRDSILEGNKCEKFLSLNLKEKGVSSTKIYTVRKIENYVFVDLNNPVSEGKDEAYKEGRFVVENYKDTEDRSNWENNANVLFKYTNYNSFSADVSETLSYAMHTGWVYQNTWNIDTIKNGARNGASANVPDVYKGLYQKSFYDGLVLLAKPGGIFEQEDIAFNYGSKLGEKVNVYINQNSKVTDSVNADIISVNGKAWNNLGPEEINRFIYNILNGYNRHLSAPAPFNPNVGGP